MAQPLIVLVPGFLGFQKLGNLPYFPGVESAILRCVEPRGYRGRVVTITQLPTSSLAARAARLCETISEVAGDADSIDLIGHSTGGLDCRLLTTPGAALPTEVDVESIACRVRTIVTVSTPHHGTPLASFFAGVQGHRMLRLLSLFLARLLRFGKRPLRGAVAIGRAVVLLDKLTGLDDSLLEHLYGQVLHGLPHEHREELEKLLDDVGGDQRLIEQLAPVSIELFNASAADRRSIRYGCVVTRGPKPKLRSMVKGLRDPYAQLSRLLYYAMHKAASSLARERQASLCNAQAGALIDAYGLVPGAGDNDGIVPTLSQVHGEVIAGVRADHLDAMGYYGDGYEGRVDWLLSDAGFNRMAFEDLWQRVGCFITPETA